MDTDGTDERRCAIRKICVYLWDIRVYLRLLLEETADEHRWDGWARIFDLNICVYLWDIRVYLRLILEEFADEHRWD
jgi:hypothetical protein